MVKRLFRVVQDQRYDYLKPSEKDWESWRAKMTEGMDYDKSARGVPLASRWNEDWEFEVLDFDTVEHPGGLGDFADLNKLIAATNERAFDFLKPLLGEAAEVLKGRYAGGDLWLFNVIRHVDRGDIETLPEGAVFRVKPIGLDIICDAAFKEAVESSGFKGLKFREVDPNAKVPMV